MHQGCREAVGNDTKFMVDANNAWTVKKAITLGSTEPSNVTNPVGS